MRPEEVLRAAALIIRRGGLSQGGKYRTARDADGREVPLMATGSSETGRAVPNNNAVRFTIYGAIVRAIHSSPDGIQRQSLLFDVALRVALKRLDGQSHGSDSPHAVERYNEMPGLTKQDAAEFLEECATECEKVGDGPYPPPIDPNNLQIAVIVPPIADGRTG